MILTDEKLYELCKKYGERARFWRQKFAGLLPEVYRRRLYEKKGFGSIFEFAAKLAGMSAEQVSRVLNLDRAFEDKPILKNLLETGEVSVNKLIRVASVATPENQLFWAAQAKILSKQALETLIRDEKSVRQNANTSTDQSNMFGLYKPFFEDKSVPRHKSDEKDHGVHGFELRLSPEVRQKLLELQNKGIDINQLLLEFLKKRELEIAQEKERLAVHVGSADSRTVGRLKPLSPRKSRYIPVQIRKIIQKEHGKKCSITTCGRNASTIHHTQRFAMAGNHNPYFLAPLCREHHIIAHSIDFNFHNMRMKNFDSS